MGAEPLFERVAQALRGRYSLIRELGHGGMATVYLASDAKLRRQVAIKVLAPTTRAYLGSERFQLEVRLAAQLSHPHIVPLFEADEADGLLYYVMEYVEGETLADRLRREGPLRLEDALRITAQIADALQYAHDRGIIHRDIKPANVLLARGHALVTDFGVAKITDAAAAGGSPEKLTGTGIGIGTVGYMSPEQAAGERRIDARSDIYALGVLLYEMLVGEPPFTGKSYQAIVSRVMVDPPRPLRTTRSDVPPHVELAILGALAKTPAERPPTAQNFVERLSTGTTPPMLSRRALAVAAALLLTVGLGSWAAWKVVGRSTPATAPNSVAVLYFDNLSSDSAYAYLGDALTEELLDRLAGVPRLVVRPSFIMRQYRNAMPTDPVAVGQRLAAAFLVSGAVRYYAQRVRVSVELVRASSGRRVWGTVIDRPMTDLLAVTQEIATDVAGGIVGQLAPGDEAVLSVRPTNNPKAYDHYLRGGVHFGLRIEDPRAILRGLREFEAAVALDSTFARAYARIGVSYGLLLQRPNVTATNLSVDTLLARGFVAADRALRRDSTTGEAWLARAYLLAQGGRLAQDDSGPARALAALHRARSLEPRNPDVLNGYGALVLYGFGNIDSSRPAFEQALEIDPTHPTYLQNLALVSFVARRFEDARRWWDSAAAMAPRSGPIREGRAMVRLVLGDTAGARADALSAGESQPTWPWPKAMIGLIDLRHGDTASARRIAGRLAAESPVPEAGAGLAVGALLTAVGQHDDALNYLELVRPRVGYRLPLILRFPFFDSLRASARFQRLVEESRPPGGPT